MTLPRDSTNILFFPPDASVNIGFLRGGHGALVGKSTNIGETKATFHSSFRGGYRESLLVLKSIGLLGDIGVDREMSFEIILNTVQFLLNGRRVCTNNNSIFNRRR